MYYLIALAIVLYLLCGLMVLNGVLEHPDTITRYKDRTPTRTAECLLIILWFPIAVLAIVLLAIRLLFHRRRGQ